MGCTVEEVTKVMNEIAPERLAEDWDNVGLLVGDRNSPVNRVMVTLDVTEEVIKDAIAKKVDVIVCHHPIIFKPIKRLNRESFLGRMVYDLIANGISVYCAHTNLDKAPQGVDDTLAEVLGLQNITSITVERDEGYNKIVVFVPKGHEDKVMKAMVGEGAGWIGNYSHCTFQLEGTGTFLPLEGSNPYIGQPGVIEKVKEIRLETIAPTNLLDRIISAMKEVHPYEEVAYDIYPLVNKVVRSGFGRIGRLSRRISLKEYIKVIETKLKTTSLNIYGDVDKKVLIVASCAGAGAEFVEKAKLAGADVYITGEIKYHTALEAAANGMTVIEAGHFHTERPVIDKLIDRLQMTFNSLQYNIEVIPSKL